MSPWILKTLISALTIAAVTEVAKRNNALASLIHSLPLTSLLAFIWLYTDTRDSELIGRHAYGTFWMVLPTLPMFLLMPRLIRLCGGFWPALGCGVLLTFLLYLLTLRVLKWVGITL
jgi:hypothetical protein